jgi:hypothetical protein
MHTRRQLLQRSIVLPFVMGAGHVSGLEIICEPDCLSQESARGFSSVKAPSGRFVVVCGAAALSRELLRRAFRGEWIIWESAPRLSRSLAKGGFYVHYSWPRREMTRSFLQPIPVACPDDEVIARHDATPVAMKRRYGRGGIVFLGSMLGPNLYAEEPEAQRIAAALFREL